MWDLIVSVPDHCLSIYFVLLKYISIPQGNTSVPIRRYVENMPMNKLHSNASKYGNFRG